MDLEVGGLPRRGKRRWEFFPKPEADPRPIPPLCSDVIGFSSTAFLPGTVAASLLSAFQQMILAEIPVRQAIEHQVCSNHSLMKGTGIILGSSDEDGPEYKVFLRYYPQTNLFGLPYPPHCQNCGCRTECRDVRPGDKSWGRCRIVCQQETCRWGTQWFTPAVQAKVETDRSLFLWRLPFPVPLFEWVAPKKPGDHTPHKVTTLPFV